MPGCPGPGASTFLRPQCGNVRAGAPTLSHPQRVGPNVSWDWSCEAGERGWWGEYGVTRSPGRGLGSARDACAGQLVARVGSARPGARVEVGQLVGTRWLSSARVCRSAGHRSAHPAAGSARRGARVQVSSARPGSARVCRSAGQRSAHPAAGLARRGARVQVSSARPGSARVCRSACAGAGQVDGSATAAIRVGKALRSSACQGAGGGRPARAQPSWPSTV
jgi:hypothetical protein